MSLLDATRRAQQMAAAEDSVAAEGLLGAVAQLADVESDEGVLRRYADACHRWGPQEAEEVALRALLRRSPDIDTIESLLDILQQKLNRAGGETRELLVTECIALGTDALRLVQPGSGLTWANLVRARGLRHLDKVRLGHREHAAKARSDIDAYLSWLKENESVPEYLQRGNLIASAEIDVGELLLLEGRREDAARILEKAIQYLESTKALAWMLDHAYLLLERASD